MHIKLTIDNVGYGRIVLRSDAIPIDIKKLMTFSKLGITSRRGANKDVI